MYVYTTATNLCLQHFAVPCPTLHSQTSGSSSSDHCWPEAVSTREDLLPLWRCPSFNGFLGRESDVSGDLLFDSPLPLREGQAL